MLSRIKGPLKWDKVEWNRAAGKRTGTRREL
jgi:hypothetical protein